MPDLKTELSKVTAVAPQPTLPTETDKKRENRRVTASPVFVRKLADKFGNVETGRLLGYSASGISNVVQGRDEIGATAEYLAERIWREMEQKGEAELPSDQLYIVRVTPDKVEAYTAVCMAMGILHFNLDEL